MSFVPFEMERWQSIHENDVGINLSESGVHPLSVGELLELAGADGSVDPVRLGYGYSNGSPALREAISALYSGAAADNIVTFNGSAEANFHAAAEVAGPGDRVVVLLPTYMQIPGLLRMSGARVQDVWLREELGWQPDPDEIRRAAAGARAIVLTNPSNPTGATLSGEAREAIVAAANTAGAWIIADEVYAGAELSGPITPSFWGSVERVIATGSLSKAYGMPGLRVGWAVAPRGTAERLWARGDYTTISHGPLSDYLATLALQSEVRQRILERTRRLLRENLAVVDSVLGRAGFRYRPPAAGAILWARYPGEIESLELAERARRDHDVLIVPGAHFLMEGFCRIGYGIPARELKDGLSRLLHALEEALPVPIS